jgi:hypothetical protein
VSGDGGGPVAGATVQVDGHGYTSDAAGRVTLDRAVNFGAPLDAAAPAVLDRQTLLRAGGGTAFLLWPRRTRAGIDEGYTSFLVYGDAAGSRPMARLAEGAQVVVVPSEELLADDLANAMHVAAVARVNAAAQGLFGFALSRQRPAAGVVFESRLDPADAACAGGRIRAQVTWMQRSNEILGGSILFCTREAARTGTVLHEMGHTLGFAHSPNPNDLMFSTFVRGRNDDFSERELLTLSLMMRRLPGNRYPDRDRDRAAASRDDVHSIACPR